MNQRPLGSSNLKVSAIGFGCRGMRPGDLREIKAASGKIVLQGGRYPENLQELAGR